MFWFIFGLLHQPLYQFAIFFVLTLLFVPFLMKKDANVTWNLAGLFYVIFIVTNAVFLFFADNTWPYFFLSLLASVLYVVVGGSFISWLISALKITGSGESGMIFLVIIYHPVVLLLVILLKWFFL